MDQSTALNAPIPDQMLVYKSIGGIDLNLHVFYPQDHQPGDHTPTILFFFGGGWINSNPTQFYPHSTYLASRGMVAICADYRVKSLHGTTPFESVSDGKSAMRWVRQHADDLGVDPNHIAAGGGSAGGHVAAATATLKEFDDPTDDLSVSAKPNALVLFNPVIDNGPEGYGYERVRKRWREFSPIHNVTYGIPSTILFFGSEDKLVPVSQVHSIHDRIIATGARCDLHIYSGQKHGFFNYVNKGGNTYYQETLAEADKFLTSLGYLSPETLNSIGDAQA